MTILSTQHPSTVTTQQLQAEIAALREAVEVRLVAIDKAVEILQGIAPTIVDMKALVEEQFARIDTILDERDRRDAVIAAAHLTAVQAALQTQTEAIAATRKATGLAIARAEESTSGNVRAARHRQRHQRLVKLAFLIVIAIMLAVTFLTWPAHSRDLGQFGQGPCSNYFGTSDIGERAS